jgi:hypothetical protein
MTLKQLNHYDSAYTLPQKLGAAGPARADVFGGKTDLMRNRASHEHFLLFFQVQRGYKPPLRREGETMPKRNGKRQAWTLEHVRTLKALARKKTPASKIAWTLKRTEGATRQKAFSLGFSLESRF